MTDRDMNIGQQNRMEYILDEEQLRGNPTDASWSFILGMSIATIFIGSKINSEPFPHMPQESHYTTSIPTPDYLFAQPLETNYEWRL